MVRWVRSLFQPGRSQAERAKAHMTFRESSVGRTVRRTGMILKRQIWAWPIIAVGILAIVGYTVSSTINHIMIQSLRSELVTLLSVEQAMLEKWFKVQEANALRLANEPQIRATIIDLVASTKRNLVAVNPSAEPTQANGIAKDTMSLQLKLQDQLATSMTSNNFVGYALADKQLQIVAAQTQELIGKSVPQYESILVRTFEGQPTVSAPFPSVVALRDRAGRERTGTPTIWVCAPVRDENLQVIAVLGMRIRPEREFTEILQLGRMGETGETYAVNRDGVMVSNSRFDDQLIMLGLLPDEPDAASILKVQVRDPGGDLNRGFRPKVRRSEMALTTICTNVLSGSSGVLMDGYRNYRGAMAVGAWSWLPQYEIGLITEIDSDEAFLPLTIIKRTFYWIYALLALSAAAIFAFTLIVTRLKREAQKAVIEAKQLGQYHLESRLGEGAMGIVYKGHHAMLRRPTAIKLLPAEKIDASTIARFEREVQITCKLNHPSTIAIYDFGRTPEGVFYYAMEFLDGINLQCLVERYGPQPESRVVHILKQVCGSLFEAHSLGLVHRDIKPANIMLSRRGCEPDVVKVLDFGLVKDIDEASSSGEGGGLSGTPLYMSPEAIQTPDAVDGRSDLYSLGAVAYFLLTGKPVFEATSLAELCQQHIAKLPDPPSSRLNRTISPGIENAVMSCLEKTRARRPHSARELSQLLEASSPLADWTMEMADAWWRRHDREIAKDGNSTPFQELSFEFERSAAKPSTVQPKSSGFDQTMEASGSGDNSPS